MGWIDTTLNYTIPPIIFIVFGYWFYKMFNPMFEGLGGAFGGLWGKVKGEEQESQKITNITYE